MPKSLLASVVQIVTAIGVAFSFSSITEAQSYAQLVWDQLQEHYNQIEELKGYTLTNYIIGKLGHQETDAWTFTLSKNAKYVITGACDEDCSDLDITVKSGSRVIVSDDLEDDAPVVRFAAPESGRYDIEIKMFNCEAEYCYFGIGLFEGTP